MRLGRLAQKIPFKWLLPLLLLFGFLWIFQYSAALSAAPGFESRLVTNPRFLEKYLKTAQVFVEYRPCAYELLGWQNDILYFQSDCKTNTQFWRFDANKTNQPQLMTIVPKDIAQIIVPHNDALQMVCGYGVLPFKHEAAARDVMLVGDGFASPDGVWTAVITQHLYAPQDILIIKEAP